MKELDNIDKKYYCPCCEADGVRTYITEYELETMGCCYSCFHRAGDC